MYDDDIDRNGIPDMIQREPAVAPEPFDLFGEPPEVGLPGITGPIEAPEPDEPTAPDGHAPEAPPEIAHDAVPDKARTANKAANQMDDYLKS
jgi:hypothetical protein